MKNLNKNPKRNAKSKLWKSSVKIPRKDPEENLIYVDSSHMDLKMKTETTRIYKKFVTR